MITIVSQPLISVPVAFNRILFKISSDNTSAIGFKFVAKIFDAITNEIIATLYYDTAATYTDPIEIDVSKAIRNYFTYNHGLNEIGVVSFDNNLTKRFYIKFYEYYDVNGDGIYIIDNSTEVISNTFISFAGSFPLLELDNWNNVYADRIGTSTDPAIFKPLTDWNICKMRADDEITFAFLDPFHYIQNFIFVNEGDEISVGANHSGTDIVYCTFSMAYFGANYSPYTLIVNYDNGAELDYAFATIYLQECTKNEPLRLAYLNKYGAFDYFNFNLVNKQSFANTKKEYQRDYTGSLINGFGIVQNTNPIYYVKETEKWKLISDYLTDSQAILIRDLYSSPLVYMQQGGTWIPIKLTPNVYELKKTLIDKVFNLEIDIEFTFDNFRQSI